MKKLILCQENSGLSQKDFWDAHPLARHMRDSTKPKLYIGCNAPDAEVFHKGEYIWLHDVIKNYGGGVPLPVRD
eukprot:5350990-Pyramimonas_sp.AAC.3